MTRKLIINTDDYGVCAEVNAAVEELIERGVLRSVSLLANGECREQAVNFLKARPEVSAGIHLNVVEGRPVSTSPVINAITGDDGNFLGLASLLRRWLWRPREVSRAVETEWRVQIELLLASKLNLTHADSHQHLHAFPPAYRCAVRLCHEYRIPSLRNPAESLFSRRRCAEALALRTSLQLARLLNNSQHLYLNDYFLGFNQAGNYDINTIKADLGRMPEGLTELAIHPSVKDGYPYFKFNGRREY